MRSPVESWGDKSAKSVPFNTSAKTKSQMNSCNVVNSIIIIKEKK